MSNDGQHHRPELEDGRFRQPGHAGIEQRPLVDELMRPNQNVVVAESEALNAESTCHCKGPYLQSLPKT